MAEHKIHPFEAAGMGRYPFRCVGVASFPSKGLLSANPDAYNNAMRALPWQYRLGTCHHCGMALTHNFLIESSDGVKSSVGCNCVEKTDDKALTDEVLRLAAKMEREKRRAKREAQRAARHAKWLEDNAERLAKEAEERAAKEAAEQARRQLTRERWAFVLPALNGQRGDFVMAMAQKISDGEEPYGRAKHIVGEIYAKTFGRAGSKAFMEAFRDFEQRVGE